MQQYEIIVLGEYKLRHTQCMGYVNLDCPGTISVDPPQQSKCGAPRTTMAAFIAQGGHLPFSGK